MIIEVYADVLCGWAWIGKGRLEQALDQLGDSVDATVVWRPYLIDPTAPSPSVSLALALAEPGVERALEQCAPGIDAAVRRLEVGQLGMDELGLPRWGAEWRASSWAAWRMVTAALVEHGPQVHDEVMTAVLRGHFVDGADINSLAFLSDLADRFGLPAPAAKPDHRSALAYLEPGFAGGDPVERATRIAQLSGQAIDVATSPTFVVDGRIIGTGAQPADVLAGWIAEAAAEQGSVVPEEVRQFRNARALLERNNPRGTLYLLSGLPELAGERSYETLTARALAASASLEPARAKLEQLLERYPDDAYLQVLMGKTLRRMQDPRAAKHLALAGAMNPEFLDF
ncbi:DsbA family protein [Propionibacteriaceae bacterium Y2011]